MSSTTISAVSEKRLAANRANALKSTGPRTQQGKSKSALNALTHGLRARLSPDTLVPDHERQDFTALVTALHEELLPQTPLQQLLADRIALLLWKQRRTAAAEARLLDDLTQTRRNNAQEENTRTRRRYAHALSRHHADPDKHPAPNEPTLLPLPTAAQAQAQLAQAPSRHNPWLTLHRYDQATQRELHKALKQYLALQQAAQEHDENEDDPLDTAAPNEPTEVSNPEISDSQISNSETPNPPSVSPCLRVEPTSSPEPNQPTGSHNNQPPPHADESLTSSQTPTPCPPYGGRPCR